MNAQHNVGSPRGGADMKLRHGMISAGFYRSMHNPSWCLTSSAQSETRLTLSFKNGVGRRILIARH